MENIYEQVISKQIALISVKDDKDAVTEKMNELIGFLMDNFSGIPSNEQVTPIFNNTIDTCDIEALKSLDVAAVPIAVVRYLLAVERLWISPVRCENWERFSESYGNKILEC